MGKEDASASEDLHEIDQMMNPDIPAVSKDPRILHVYVTIFLLTHPNHQDEEFGILVPFPLAIVLIICDNMMTYCQSE